MCVYAHTIEYKSTLVTGVSSGIGRETAQLLAQHGARVFGAARNPKSAKPSKKPEQLGFKT